MAEQESFQERTEEPTAKRLRDARDKGQVPRSRELSGMTVMMFGTAGVLLMLPDVVTDLLSMFQTIYTLPRQGPMETSVLLDAFADGIVNMLISLAPLFLLVSVAALAGPLLIGGWAMSASRLAPKLEKISPLKGVKRMFSLNALVELAKALAKFGAVAAMAAVVLINLWEPLLGLRDSSLESGLRDAGWMLGWSFVVLSLGLVVIAMVDVPFQLYQFRKQMRMTRQEVRDEMKETEGNPEVRSRIRQMQQELAQARMMEEVPKADVVITNPTHYAVALRYDERNMRAPVVVAKGTDLLAQRIRDVANEHSVAVVEAALLARALHASTDLRQPIPAQLYLAVAQVLAFVLQLRVARRSGRTPPRPPSPDVPQEFIDKLRRRNRSI